MKTLMSNDNLLWVVVIGLIVLSYLSFFSVVLGS